MRSGKGTVSTTILVVIISVLVTLVIVAVVLSIVGVERAAKDVSPLVERAQDRLTDGMVPESKRADEPKTDADRIMEAVSANRGATVMIHRLGDDGAFVARGIVIGSDGRIISDAGAVKQGTEYVVSVPGRRERVPATCVREHDGIALINADFSTSLVARIVEDTPEAQRLVVSLTGDERMRIATGIVTGSDAAIGVISTNILGVIAPGSPLVDKDGSVVGISTIAVQGGEQAAFRLLNRTMVDELSMNGC